MLDLKRLSGEYAMLSYLVTCAERARDVFRRAMVAEDSFTDADCRAAFLALMREPSADATTLLNLARNLLPALGSDADIDKFLGLSDNFAALEHDAFKFSTAAILRENAATLQSMLAQAPTTSPELLLDGQAKAAASAQAKINAVRAALCETSAAPAASAAPSAAIDPALLHIPGFVDELARYSQRTAQRPNLALSFVGALAMLAHLAARKFAGPNDSRPNIYLVSIADSGVGKDWPRKVNRKIAAIEGLKETVKDSLASGQAIEDAIAKTPALLMQMDEFDSVLNVLKDDKGSKTATEAMWRVMLSLFTSSSSFYTKRLKAESARGGGGGKIVYSPSLTILANATPSKFYAALCERALDNGFLARCLVIESDERSDFNFESGMDSRELPPSVVRMLRHLSNLGRRFAGNVEIDPRDITFVPFAEGGQDEAKRVNKEADALYDKARREGDDMAKSVWNRSLELVLKLALLYAISETLGTTNDFAISPAAVNWAWRFVKSLQLRMLEMVAENTAVNPLDEKVQKALRLVKRAGRKGIARAALSRKTHLSSKELDEIEATLLDRDEISVRALPHGANGRAAKLYIALKGK